MKLYYVVHDIPADTADHDYEFPEGLDYNNAIFVTARVLTRYNTVVDPTSYYDGAYWGTLSYYNVETKINKFRFTCNIAGAITKGIFCFARWYHTR